MKVFIVAVVIVLFIYFFPTLIMKLQDVEALHKKYDHSVILYSASWCGYCRKTREVLSGNNIPFIELDIEKSTDVYSEFKSLGGVGVPLVLVNKEIVKGFNPMEVMTIYAKKNLSSSSEQPLLQ